MSDRLVQAIQKLEGIEFSDVMNLEKARVCAGGDPTQPPESRIRRARSSVPENHNAHSGFFRSSVWCVETGRRNRPRRRKRGDRDAGHRYLPKPSELCHYDRIRGWQLLEVVVEREMRRSGLLSNGVLQRQACGRSVF